MHDLLLLRIFLASGGRCLRAVLLVFCVLQNLTGLFQILMSRLQVFLSRLTVGFDGLDISFNGLSLDWTAIARLLSLAGLFLYHPSVLLDRFSGLLDHLTMACPWLLVLLNQFSVGLNNLPMPLGFLAVGFCFLAMAWYRFWHLKSPCGDRADADFPCCCSCSVPAQRNSSASRPLFPGPFFQCEEPLEPETSNNAG